MGFIREEATMWSQQHQQQQHLCAGVYASLSAMTSMFRSAAWMIHVAMVMTLCERCLQYLFREEDQAGCMCEHLDLTLFFGSD